LSVWSIKKLSLSVALTLLSITHACASVPLQYTNAGVSPQGDRIAVPLANVLAVIKTSDLTAVRKIDVPGSTPRYAAWSPDGKYVAVAGEGGYGDLYGQVTVLRTDTWRPVAFVGVDGRPYRPAFVPGTTELVVISGDSKVELWDYAKNRVVRRYPFEGRPQNVAVSTTGEFIAVGGQPTVYVYRINGRLMRKFQDGLGAVAISPDNRRLLYTDDTGLKLPVHEVNLSTGRRKSWSYDEDAPDLLFYRRDGKSFSRVVLDEPDASMPVWVKTVATLASQDATSTVPHVSKSPFLPPPLHWPVGRSRAVGAWTIVPIAKSSEDHASVSTVPDASTTDLYFGKIGYRLPGQVFTPSLSPDRQYVAYVTAQRIDTGDVVPIRVLDLHNAKLSPEPFPSTYDGRLIWSPNSRYLVVFDGGFDGVKGSSQHVMHCWDIQSNTERAIATAWTLDASWSTSGVLDIVSGDAKTGVSKFIFDPNSGMISPGNNTVK